LIILSVKKFSERAGLDMWIVRESNFSFDDCTIDLPQDDAADWAIGDTYPLSAQVVRDHKIFVSVIADNVGIDPLLEDQSLAGVRWLLKGYINAFRFMDGVLSNRTVGTGSITLEVANLSKVDTLILFGLTGNSVTITGRTVGGAVLHQSTHVLNGRLVSDWLGWFTTPFEEFSEKVVLSGLPSGVSSYTIELVGDELELGEVVMGRASKIGKCQVKGTDGAAVSHSTVEFNQYGILAAVRRPVRTEMTYSVATTAQHFSQVKPFMDRMSGDRVAAIGSFDRPSTVQFGILGVVKWDESHTSHYVYRFKIRGVI
jgi:hypothetical protein